jgi:hypothetical protein
MTASAAIRSLCLPLAFCAILLALCTGCEQSTSPSADTPLVKLAVGNSWQYRITDWSGTRTGEIKIHGAETHAGEQWYRVFSWTHTMLANRDDGLWVRSRSRDSNELLLAKYRVRPGETYGGDTLILFSVEGEPIPCIHSVHVDAVNRWTTVPAGTFICTVYTESLWGVNTNTLYHRATYSLAPRIGFVKIDDWTYGLYELTGANLQ